ncbi:hypothetical protein [Natrarchaeobaculum aegyptiacum]|nr:hypothetical protein [Natrarchaeobaculum aegyptiacum]
MPTTEADGQDRSLAEVVAKEAVELGLETPLREPILEAVDEAEGTRGRGNLSLLGAFGAGTTLGFLAGKGMETPTLEDLGETDLPGGMGEQVDELSETAGQIAETEPLEEVGETTGETPADDETGSGSRLPRLLLLAGLVAGAVLVRRRLKSSEEEEWEPIEEFEPATELDEDTTGAETIDSDTDVGDDADTDVETGDEAGSAVEAGDESDDG